MVQQQAVQACSTVMAGIESDGIDPSYPCLSFALCRSVLLLTLDFIVHKKSKNRVFKTVNGPYSTLMTL